MMITNAQLELLESCIGLDGFLIETIMENTQYDHGTKILYLARAVRKNCHAYLLDLDKLYDEHANNDDKPAMLELIQSLKRINDLCFNHQIKSGDFGLTEALTFMFSRLGPVNPSEFHQKIVEMIHAKIEALMNTEGTQIKAQQKHRRTLEKSISGQIQWRKTLDLPKEQQVPIASVVDGGLFKARKYSVNQISEAQLEVLLNSQLSIDNEIWSVSTLVGIMDIHSNIREDHEGLQLLKRVGALYYFANIPLETLFSLGASRLMQVANHVDNVIRLVKEANIPFDILADLPNSKSLLFLKYAKHVKTLLIDENHTIEQLLNLSPDDLKMVLKHPLSENTATLMIQASSVNVI